MSKIGSNILKQTSMISLPTKQYPEVNNKFVKTNMSHISAEPIELWLKNNPSKFYYVEPKWDGERDFLTTIKEIKLVNKHKSEYTNLPYYLEKSIKDYTNGKKVVLDSEFRTETDDVYDFLSARAHMENTKDGPLRLEIFDIINYDGYDVRGLPLIERKKLLATFKANKYVHTAPAVKCKNLTEINEVTKKLLKVDAEGFIIKTSHGTYRDEWLKHKFKDSIDLAIIGIKKTAVYKKGGLPYAFLAGVYDKAQGGYIPIGDIGNGFDDDERRLLDIELNKNKAFEDDKYIYSNPTQVVEVEFIKLTKNLKMREPAVVRLRHDKGPEQCLPKQLLELAEK